MELEVCANFHLPICNGGTGTGLEYFSDHLVSMGVSAHLNAIDGTVIRLSNQFPPVSDSSQLMVAFGAVTHDWLGLLFHVDIVDIVEIVEIG